MEDEGLQGDGKALNWQLVWFWPVPQTNKRLWGTKLLYQFAFSCDITSFIGTMDVAHPPQINVYACFPLAVEPGSDLNVDPSNWCWVHCLTIPLETLNTLQFSQRPYKWIRYAIGIVVGAEGHLSSSSNFPNTVDYNAGLPAESATLFYHISNEEKQRMFPFDPNMGCTNITTSVATTQREKFRDEVAVRDGRQCVLTGVDDVSCDAVHLVAHSKGDIVCYYFSQSIVAHHHNCSSTLQLIPSTIVETPPEVTLYKILMMSEMAFF